MFPSDSAWPVARLPLALVLLVLSPCLAAVNIYTANYDQTRRGANLEERILNTTTVNPSTFGKLWTYPIDGSVFAQPLYISNVNVPDQGVFNVLYVCTMNDVVYAFDADSPDRTLWKLDFRNESANIYSVTYREVGRDYKPPIIGNIGIMGAPHIDIDSNTMYLVARTKRNASNVVDYYYHLHAIDISTGVSRPGSPRLITGAFNGTASEGRRKPGNVVPFDAKLHTQRAGLAMASGQIWVTFAALSDTGPFHGWIYTIDAVTLNITDVFCTTPNGDMGGIWMGGRGPAVDEDDNVYYQTGNGAFDGQWNWGNTFLKLKFLNGKITVLDWFLTTDYVYYWQILNQQDIDVGSTGPMLIPRTDLVVGASKTSTIFVLHRDDMGKNRTANNTQSYQFVENRVPGASNLRNQVKNSVAYYDRQDDCLGPWYYVWGEQTTLNAYRFDEQQLRFDPEIISRSTMTAPLGSANGAPSSGNLAISANGSSPGSGIVWAAIPGYDQGAEFKVGPGWLRAFDAADLSREIWNSTMNPARDEVGNWAKWVPPIVANGKVYLATFSDRLVVYGVLPPEQQTTPWEPPPVTYPSAVALTNGAGFDVNIERKHPCEENYWRGGPYAFTINGTQVPELTLYRNQKYTFRLAMPCTYPFYFTQSVTGGPWDTTRITSGVVGPYTVRQLPAGPAVRNRPLRKLPEFICQNNNITLQVYANDWNIDGQLQFTTRSYVVNGTVMGAAPTIVMKAGTWCNITLLNSLSWVTPVSFCNYHGNLYHCPDTTNLHTHGLHVSPDQDDVSVTVKPGEVYTYHYDIPHDHLMGTHWYHAHHHGSVTLQVMGGLAGALLVQPADDYELPADIAALYEDGGHVMVFQHMMFGGSDSVNVSTAFQFQDYPKVSQQFSMANERYQALPPNALFYDLTVKDFYAVNGQYQPVVTIQPNDVTLLRMVHATAIRFLELELDDPNAYCTWQIIARDGVFHKPPYHTPLAIVMSPGTRVDVAVRCSAAAAGRNITVKAFPNPIRDPALGTENRYTQAQVFVLAVRELGQPKVADFPASEAPLPQYLDDLMNADVAVSGKNLKTILFSMGEGMTQTVNNVAFPGFMVDDDELYIDTLCLDSVYEYTVFPPGGGYNLTMPAGKTSAHPYHQHVNHFQLTSFNNVDATAARDIVRMGEWRDTVPAFAPNGVTFRFRPALYTGQMVMHCHILPHEDYGMMAVFKVAPAGSSQCFFNGSTNGTTPGGSSSGGSTSPPLYYANVTVMDNYYAPASLTVYVGTNVKWTHGAEVPHTVTSGTPGNPTSGPDSFSGLVPSFGSSYDRTFWAIGTFPYYCEFHGAMTGTIVVVGAPTTGVAEGGGVAKRQVGAVTTGSLTTGVPPPAPPTPGWARSSCNGAYLDFTPGNDLPSTIYANSFFQMWTGFKINLVPKPTTTGVATTGMRTTALPLPASTTAVATTGIPPHVDRYAAWIWQDSGADGWEYAFAYNTTTAQPVPLTPFNDPTFTVKGTRDNKYLRSVIPPGGSSTFVYMAANNVSNAVPPGATVIGLRFFILRRGSAAGLVDSFFGLSIGGVRQESSNQCPAGSGTGSCVWPAAWPPGTPYFGGYTNSWSTPMSPSMANNLAIAIQTVNTASTPIDALIDEMHFELSFLTAAPTTSVPTTSTGTSSTGTSAVGTSGTTGTTSTGTTAAPPPPPTVSLEKYQAIISQDSDTNGWMTAYNPSTGVGNPLPVGLTTTIDQTLKGVNQIYVRSLVPPGTSSSTVWVYAFSNALPVGAVPVGIRAYINRRATASGLADSLVALIINGVVRPDTNQCPGPSQCNWGTTASTLVFGGVSSLWGLPSLTREEVNANTYGVGTAGFGFALSVRNDAGSPIEALWDQMSFTIYYYIQTTTSTGTTSTGSTSTGTTSTGTTSTGTTSTGTTSTGTSAGSTTSTGVAVPGTTSSGTTSTGTTSTGTTSTGSTSTGTTSTGTTSTGVLPPPPPPPTTGLEKYQAIISQDSDTNGWMTAYSPSTGVGNPLPVGLTTTIDQTLKGVNQIFVRSLVAPGATTSTVWVYAYSNAMPAGAVVVGLRAYLNRRATAIGLVDSTVALIVDGVVRPESNQCPGRSQCNWPTSAGTVVFGGVSSLWGLPSLTREEVNANTYGLGTAAFGLAVAVRNTAGSSIEALWDQTSFTVYYYIPTTTSTGTTSTGTTSTGTTSTGTTDGTTTTTSSSSSSSTTTGVAGPVSTSTGTTSTGTTSTGTTSTGTTAAPVVVSTVTRYTSWLSQSSTVAGWNMNFSSSWGGQPVPVGSAVRDTSLKGREGTTVHATIPVGSTTSTLYIIGFSNPVPAGSTIVGLRVWLTRRASAVGLVDSQFALVVNGVLYPESNVCPGGAACAWSTASSPMAVASFGGPTSTWGLGPEVLTAAGVNAFVSGSFLGFGLAISASNTGGSDAIEAFLEVCELAIWYTAAPPTTSTGTTSTGTTSTGTTSTGTTAPPVAATSTTTTGTSSTGTTSTGTTSTVATTAVAPPPTVAGSVERFTSALYQTTSGVGWNSDWASAASPGAPTATPATFVPGVRDNTVKARNSVFAHTTLQPGEESATLYILGWSNPIPATATVTGIRVTFMRRASAVGAQDTLVALILNGVIQSASNQCPATAACDWLTPSAVTQHVFGGNSFSWGLSTSTVLTPAAVNGNINNGPSSPDHGFGLALAVRNTASSPVELFFDSVSIIMYYTTPA